MNLQGNGNNHNKRPNLEEDNSFISFSGEEDYERITGQHAPTGSSGTVDFGSDEERSKRLQEAIDKENSSAYEDLDDFVYRQNKKRARSSGKRHHHRHRSPSVLSPSHTRKTSSKKHRHKHHFHKHHHRKKKIKRWQKIIIGILLSLIALVVAAIIAFIVMVNMGRAALLDKTGLNINPPKQATVEDSGNYIVYKGQKYKYNDNITSILCMGIDKDSLGSIDGQVGTGGDADSIFLLTMDLETGESTIVNISRDTMAEIGVYAVNGTYVGTKKAQLALAYAYGDGKETSCHNEIVAVRQIFYNLPINSYLSLDLDGIGPINDSIGGVTVVSPETIGDFKAGETYELFGSMATYFVRNRSHATIEGNNLRMQRQKTYLDSFASSLLAKTKENLTAPLGVFDSASPYICTDLNASKVSYLATQAIQSKFKGFEIRTVPGEIKKGKKYAEFYIDEDKFLEMFLDIFYKPVS